MSKKRRRKKARTRTRAAATGTPEAAEAARQTPEPGPDARDRRARQEDQRPRGLFRGAAESPFSPLGVSLATGLRVVGSSPLILAVTFLSTVLTWAIHVALGTTLSVRFMVVEMSASPMHVFFDWLTISPLADSGASLLVATIVLGIVRAGTFGLLLALITAALRGGPADQGPSLRSLPGFGLTLFAVYSVEMMLMVAAQFLLGGSQLFFLLVPLVALHFLAFVPVVAVAEGAAAREAFRKGFRAARLPGGRHLGMAVAYFLFIFYVLNGSPALSPATPSLAGWAFVLAVSFVHVGALAAFTFRWLEVREHQAVIGPPPRRSPARSGS